MLRKNLTIINKLGLHARAAAKLAKTCSQFASRVEVGNEQSMVDGKSVMSLMLLAASQNTELTICCDGDDETEAMQAVEELINDRFGEGE